MAASALCLAAGGPSPRRPSTLAHSLTRTRESVNAPTKQFPAFGERGMNEWSLSNLLGGSRRISTGGSDLSIGDSEYLVMMEEESIRSCIGEHHPALAGGGGTTKAFFIDNLLRYARKKFGFMYMLAFHVIISESGRRNRAQKSNQGKRPERQCPCHRILRL